MTKDQLIKVIFDNTVSSGDELRIWEAVEAYCQASNSGNTNVLRTLELLQEMLNNEYKLAKDINLSDAKSGQHYANTTSIEDTMRLIKEIQPIA